MARNPQRLHDPDAAPNQFWLYRELVVERPGNSADGSVDLVIKTKAVHEGSYEGGHTFSIRDSGIITLGTAQEIDITGEVSCAAD